MLDCPACHSTNLSDADVCRSCGAALSGTGSTPAHALPNGTRLQNGAFEIEALMGQGRRGLTYRGRDVSLQRAIAIKEFFPFGIARDGDGTHITAPSAMSEAEFIVAREGFKRAATALARFSDEGIPRVFRVFEENDSIYLVMEFLEGQTLAQKLARGALPIDEAIKIAAHIARTLSVIHDAQMLHRAVAPANIFLTNDGRTILIGFVAGPRTSSLLTNAPKTSGYAAPELFEDANASGPAADVYGLGATLYRVLTGSAPPPSLERLVGKNLPLPEKINSEISAELSHVVLQALQLQPEKRLQSAREFAKALKNVNAPNFSLAPAFSPQATDAPRAGSTPSVTASHTPAAPPPGASAATVALPPEPHLSSPASTVLLPPTSNSPAPAEKTTLAEASGARSTPKSAAPPRATPPIVPRSTPMPAAGTQLCPHCEQAMPAVMSRCPHCRQLKTASTDPTDGSFREWHRNENTRIGLGWALAIGVALLIMLSMWRGCESLGLKPEPIQGAKSGFMQPESTG